MKRVKLIRISRTLSETFGVLIIDGNPVCCTLELPWMDNNRNVSCIPVGIYHCTNVQKGIIRVGNVPNRDGIQIHIGNKASDIEGCILVGLEFGKNSVLASKKAMEKLQKLLPTEFVLEII